VTDGPGIGQGFLRRQGTRKDDISKRRSEAISGMILILVGWRFLNYDNPCEASV
jgi:hypothetical protein